MATVGSLRVMLSANIDGFTSAMRKASDTAGRFTRQFNTSQLLGSALGGLDAKIAAFSSTIRNMVSEIPLVGGALGAAATAGGEFAEFLIHSTKEMAGNIRAANRLGIEYNEFNALVRKSGMDAEEFASKWFKVNRVIGDAAAGVPAAVEKLKSHGLSGLTTSLDPARDIAKAFYAIKDPVSQSRMLFDLAGKGAFSMGMAFKDGAGGIDKMMGSLTQVSTAQQEQILKTAILLKQQEIQIANLKTIATLSGAPFLEGVIKTMGEQGRAFKDNPARFLSFLSPPGIIKEAAEFTGKVQGAAAASIGGSKLDAEHAIRDPLAARKGITDDLEKAKLGESIVETEAKLKKQIDTFGMSAAQIEIYDLKTRHATEAQVAQAQALADQVDALKEKIKIDKAVNEQAEKHKELAAYGKFERFMQTSQQVNLPTAAEMGSSAAVSAIAQFGSQKENVNTQEAIRQYAQQEVELERQHLEVGKQVLAIMQQFGIEDIG